MGGYPVREEPTITLSVDELDHALDIGQQRSLDGQPGYADLHDKTRNRYMNDFLACCAEHAVANHYGEPWDATVNNFKAPDQNGRQVRYIDRPDKRLYWRPDDSKDHPYVLVLKLSVEKWQIRGWRLGYEIQDLGILSDPGNRGAPIYYLPNDLLLPIKRLP
jgi:hypothetical protein